jgi:hypothetical protein
MAEYLATDVCSSYVKCYLALIEFYDTKNSSIFPELYLQFAW